MTELYQEIAKGKRRRKIIAIVASIAVITVSVVYFGYLFFTKGYSFTVLPADAKPAHYSVAKGMGSFVGDTLYVVGTGATVVVGADRYKSETLTIDADSPHNIEVELQPKPAVVSIKTEPSFTNTDWTLNGNALMTGETLEGELEVGHYAIVADHPSFELASSTFDAGPAQIIDSTLTLVPIQGNISIESEPADASVVIAQQEMGATPYTAPQLGGRYQITVTKPGYQAINDSIEVTRRNRHPKRRYTLIPLQGELTVRTQPQDGVLLINDQANTSPASLDANTPHVVTYSKAGYLNESQTITLEPDEKRQLSFNLKPEIGRVSFVASETADVVIEGQNVGRTPLTLDLQALPTQVDFVKAGFRTESKVFTPTQRSEISVKAEMLREFDARRKENRPLYATQIGIQFTPVRPRAFTMGSPVNEKDRQRNEHQVTVDFSRDIWVSKHEITQAQFALFLGQGPTSNLPVTNISWTDAALFTNWLSEKEGLMPFYLVENKRVVGVDSASRGYRLPTEAEWEYIAKLNRRSTPTAFVWGSRSTMRDDQGNFADESLRGKHIFFLKDYDDGYPDAAPVGSFKADRSGFFDLDGNVREWVHDFYAVGPPQVQTVQTDYLGVPGGDSHVVKGASYKTGRIKNIRASVRQGQVAGADDIGFRIARYTSSGD